MFRCTVFSTQQLDEKERKKNYTYTSNLALGKNDGGILSTAKKPDAAGAHQAEEEDPSRRDGHLLKYSCRHCFSKPVFLISLLPNITQIDVRKKAMYI